MKHWPWQHHFEPVEVEHVLADYLGDGALLKEGIGHRETLVLNRCACGKTKVTRGVPIEPDPADLLRCYFEMLREGLRDALQIIDEERAGTKSGWTREDSDRLEKMRALVRD
jgi:hypothetical protein